MINLEKFQDGTELNLNHAIASFSGYGHQTIEVELEYSGKYKTFKKTTTDVEAVDNAKDLGVESWEDKTQALYDIIEYSIEDQVADWMQDVDFEAENKED